MPPRVCRVDTREPRTIDSREPRRSVPRAPPLLDDFFGQASALPTAPPDGPDKGRSSSASPSSTCGRIPSTSRGSATSGWRGTSFPGRCARRMKLPAGDEGIELVAETRGGGALGDPVQVPDGHPEGPHGPGPLDLLEPELPRLPGRLPRDRRPHLRETRPEARPPPRVTEIGLDRWLAIDPRDGSGSAKRRRRPRRPKPRRRAPTQKAAVRAAVAHFLRKRGQTGPHDHARRHRKSLAAFWIAEALKAAPSSSRSRASR